MIKIKTLNNFLTDIDYKELVSLELKAVKENEMCVNQNRIYKNGDTKLECLSETCIKKLFKNYYDKGIKILNELYPEKVDLVEYCKFDIIETGKNYEFTIHDDQPETLLSGVIYLAPEKNSGTIFYDTKSGENKTEMEWEKNKGVFFSRKERNSWHSFKGDGKNNRLVLVFNLMTTDIKSVCKIEGVNYLYSQFRNFLNPYFYKFFKFTI